MTFCRPFLSFGRQKVTKRTAKSRAAFFVLQFGQQPKKDSKKSPRSFWSAKGRPGEKDGKKLWHLRSPYVNIGTTNSVTENSGTENPVTFQEFFSQ